MRIIKINGHVIEINEKIEANSTCKHCRKTKHECMTDPGMCKPRPQKTLF
jgi:hypothetical protein